MRCFHRRGGKKRTIDRYGRRSQIVGTGENKLGSLTINVEEEIPTRQIKEKKKVSTCIMWKVYDKVS